MHRFCHRHIPSALRRKVQGTRQAALRLKQQGQHGLFFGGRGRGDGGKKGGGGGGGGGGAGKGEAGEGAALFPPLQPIATTAEIVRDRGVEVGSLFFSGCVFGI